MGGGLVRISNGTVSPYLGRLWSDGRRFRKRLDCCLKNFCGRDGFVCMRPVGECHELCVCEGQVYGARIVCCGVPTHGPFENVISCDFVVAKDCYHSASRPTLKLHYLLSLANLREVVRNI